MLFEKGLIADFTFPYLIYSRNFLDTALMFFILPVFAYLLTDFEGRLLLSKVAKTLHCCNSLTSVLVQLRGLYFLKTLMASVAVTVASHVGRTLHIP